MCNDAKEGNLLVPHLSDGVVNGECHNRASAAERDERGMRLARARLVPFSGRREALRAGNTQNAGLAACEG